VKKFVANGRNQILDQPANNLVSVLTKLSQLPYSTIRVYFLYAGKTVMYFNQIYKVITMVCYT